MIVLEGKTIYGWLDWLEVEAPPLLREERDVRVTDKSGMSILGSLSAASSSAGVVAIRPYGMFEELVSLKIENLFRIEVFNSRRLRPGRAYVEMNEMAQIVIVNER